MQNKNHHKSVYRFLELKQVCILNSTLSWSLQFKNGFELHGFNSMELASSVFTTVLFLRIILDKHIAKRLEKSASPTPDFPIKSALEYERCLSKTTLPEQFKKIKSMCSQTSLHVLKTNLQTSIKKKGPVIYNSGTVNLIQNI